METADGERMVPGRVLKLGPPDAYHVIDDNHIVQPKPIRATSKHGTWVSPTSVMRKRSKVSDAPISEILTSEFQPGLTSPKKIYSTPEWSSPHRIIHRPNAEDAHANWVPMKESDQRVLHSPVQSEVNDDGNRPSSQATYTVRRDLYSSETIEKPLVMKSCILEEYEPLDRCPKKRVTSIITSYPIATGDKIKRIVHPDGRIVKKSMLDDMETKNEKKRTEGETEDGLMKTGEQSRRTTLKKMILNDFGGPAKVSPRKVKIMRRNMEEKKISSSLEEKEDYQNDKENKARNGKPEEYEPRPKEEVDEVMVELKKILNDRKEEDGAAAKRKASDGKKKTSKGEDASKRAKTVEDEKPSKKRRDMDLQAVQKYIKTQKLKRMEQLKKEREKKTIEEESRKKKLEELRIRTLQLAATTAAKKKPLETGQVPTSIKVIEPGGETEEDVTMSLGLKQTKPRVSYNESISNLKKKVRMMPKSEERRQDPGARPQDEEVGSKPVEEKNVAMPLSSPSSLEPAKLESPKADLEKTTNLALKKLAEMIELSMEKQKKMTKTIACKSVPESVSNRKVIVDVETIKTLKQDIKNISQNFRVLHEIITDKSSSVPMTFNPEPIQSKRISQLKLTLSETERLPQWVKTTVPHPHPYNVLTAVRNKINLDRRKSTLLDSSISETTQRESDTESVAISAYNTSTEKNELVSSIDNEIVERSSSGENYFSMKDESVSEFSSSILDSEKEKIFDENALKKPTDRLKVDVAVQITPSAIEEVASSSVSALVSSKKTKDMKEDLILVSPDVQLKVGCATNSNSGSISISLQTKIDSNASAVSKLKSNTEEVITEIGEDTVAESIKTSLDVAESTEVKVNEVLPRTFFNPEALHLQFQAELTLLETFQKSLAHFLDTERMKALSQGNVKSVKAVNTDDVTEVVPEENVQNEETNSVKTGLDEIQEESIRTDMDESSTITEVITERKSSESSRKKSSEKLDLSDSLTGMSFEMLNRMIQDEELRSEHHLALIRLRERTLKEKVKAELTLLEMRKKALKETGNNEELTISAIKKKQRGILMKYQNEREDIERLKKMHRIASEERKIMIKQQRQIRKMQLTTKDMLIKLKKRDKSPNLRNPLSPKGRNYSKQLEIQEELSLNISESKLTESVTSVDESVNESMDSDLDVTSMSNVSEGDDEILRRNMKTLEEKITKSIDKSVPPKKILTSNETKYMKRGRSIDELLKWTKKLLEKKESQLREAKEEEDTLSFATKQRSMKLLLEGKTVRDRSTSPFHFQEVVKLICESSPSVTEAIEGKKSSPIAEMIDSKSRTVEDSKEQTTESVIEKLSSSVSEQIQEELSKKTPVTSRSTEYYSESFESSSDTHKSKSAVSLEKNSYSNGVTIKMALSPRVDTTRRRYSSGSDESVNLLQTETASEQSDVEIRIAALHEQLRRKKLEAERLRREQKKAQRARLKAKEQSLLKQIEAYDTYILKKKQELKQEYERSSQTKMIVSPPKSTGKSEEDVQWKPKSKTEMESEVTEDIKSQAEELSIAEEITKKDADITDTKSSPSSVLESLPKQAVTSDESNSESEEQTISIASVRTNLLSLEKHELDITAKTEDVPSSEQIDNGNYSLDSFESDEKSKSVPREEIIEEEEEGEEEKEEEKEKEEQEEVCISEGPKTLTTEEEAPAEWLEDEENEFIVEEEEPVTVAESSSVTVDEEVSEITDKIPEDKNRMVDFITDSVLDGLITEFVTVMMKKMSKEVAEVGLYQRQNSVEMLTNMIAAEIVSEVVDDALKMYKKKKASQEGKTPAVLRRVHEMMSQGSKREQKRPQDLMITTYDVSSVIQDEDDIKDELVDSPCSECPDRENKQAKIEVDRFDETSQASNLEAYSQEWFDEDFGLSRTRREAEELRVQQLQIEQEIQQLQAQQEQVLYYYLRQIPNKPPPPYTPPGSATTERFTSEGEITAVMATAVRYLTDEMTVGKEVTEITPPETFFRMNDNEHVKCYKVFLFDLAKHIISEAVGSEIQENLLPWMRKNDRLSKFKLKKVERTYECLFDLVVKQVLVLFGFRQKMGKERLIVRWSRKKRDHVDELLVGEAQEEEAEWTHYDGDEVTVKNNVTIGILDSLLDETVELLNTIWTKKTKKV